MSIIDGFISVDGKNLEGKTLENILQVLLQLYASEWNSFHCNVSRIINFNVPGEFSIQNACYRFRQWFFKECLNAHIPLTRQNYAPHQPLCQVSDQTLVCKNPL